MSHKLYYWISRFWQIRFVLPSSRVNARRGSRLIVSSQIRLHRDLLRNPNNEPLKRWQGRHRRQTLPIGHRARGRALGLPTFAHASTSAPLKKWALVARDALAPAGHGAAGQVRDIARHSKKSKGQDKRFAPLLFPPWCACAYSLRRQSTPPPKPRALSPASLGAAAACRPAQARASTGRFVAAAAFKSANRLGHFASRYKTL